MTSLTKIAITGAAGRMGKMLIEAVIAADNAELTGAIVRSGSSLRMPISKSLKRTIAIKSMRPRALHWPWVRRWRSP